MYANFFKRVMDFFLAFIIICVISPVIVILCLIGAIAMRGNPFFAQKRPGIIDKKTKREKIFLLIKFRTMSNARDEYGNLLPDGKRLNGYGRFLRKTSLDELPELFNILIGDMSFVGPRPQLVRDMVFMSEEQRMRHSVRPGLTGLAQVNGRNNISWEEKFELDLKYINDKITLWGDVKIFFRTFVKVTKCEDVARDGMATDVDFGDYLLESGRIDKDAYKAKQEEAKELLEV